MTEEDIEDIAVQYMSDDFDVINIDNFEEAGLDGTGVIVYCRDGSVFELTIEKVK